MAKFCFNLFLAISLKLKVAVKLKPQTLLFCNLREVKWGSVSVPVTKAEYYSFTVRKRWKQTCLFRWHSWSLMVHFSGNITRTRPLLLKLLPSSCLSAPFLSPRRRYTSVVFTWHEPKRMEPWVFPAQPGWRSWKTSPRSPVSKHMAAEHLECQWVMGTSWPGESA